MKILAIADRPPTKSIFEIVHKEKIDLIITLGDLEYFDLKEFLKITSIPKIGVYGNHCSGQYFEPLGIQNLHLKTFKHKNQTFGGFEGCNRYSDSKYKKMYEQREASDMLKNFPPVDVMIAHSPPYSINDEITQTAHQGFVGLKEYIENKKPKHFFHGHTYPDKQEIKTKHEDTIIHYIFQDKVVEI